jgi:hypothetical protein
LWTSSFQKTAKAIAYHCPESPPAIARWVRGYGHIEIGDQEMFGFVARALDYGGLAFTHDEVNLCYPR